MGRGRRSDDEMAVVRSESLRSSAKSISQCRSVSKDSAATCDERYVHLPEDGLEQATSIEQEQRMADIFMKFGHDFRREVSQPGAYFAQQSGAEFSQHAPGN